MSAWKRLVVDEMDAQNARDRQADISMHVVRACKGEMNSDG